MIGFSHIFIMFDGNTLLTGTWHHSNLSSVINVSGNTNLPAWINGIEPNGKLYFKTVLWDDQLKFPICGCEHLFNFSFSLWPCMYTVQLNFNQWDDNVDRPIWFYVHLFPKGNRGVDIRLENVQKGNPEFCHLVWPRMLHWANNSWWIRWWNKYSWLYVLAFLHCCWQHWSYL